MIRESARCSDLRIPGASGERSMVANDGRRGSMPLQFTESSPRGWADERSARLQEGR